MKLAFLGLGGMGSRMAARLIDAGHEVTVWNRTPARMRALEAKGARATASARDAALGHEIVLLCLTDQRAVEAVVFGEDGVALAAGVRRLVDHSSIAPDASRAFAVRLAETTGAEWIDAPVSGGIGGAADGTLAVMAGGSAEGVAAIAPVVKAYAQRLTHMGPTGAGQTAKLCNQAIVSVTLAAIAEAVALAEASGIEAAKLPEALAGGWADSVLLRLFVPRMTSPYEGRTAGVSLMRKDLGNIQAAADDLGLPAVVIRAALSIYDAAIARGQGDEDLAALARVARSDRAVSK